MWSDHNHHGEYAEERHSHYDYADEHHRHYDLEREIEALRAEVAGLRSAIWELQEARDG